VFSKLIEILAIGTYLEKLYQLLQCNYSISHDMRSKMKIEK